jgi:hypothetical protein
VGAHVADGLLHTFLADLDTGVSVTDEIALHGDGDIERARSAARSARDAVG